MSKDSFRVTKEFNAALSDIAYYNPNDKTSIKKLIRAEYEGKLLLGEVGNTCSVTENGVKIFASRRLQDILKVVDENTETGKQVPGSRWTRFLGLNRLQSLFSQDFGRTY